MLSTSLSTATTMAFNVAVGFLAAAILAPTSEPERKPRAHRDDTPSDDSTAATSSDARLDDFMMENAQ